MCLPKHLPALWFLPWLAAHQLGNVYASGAARHFPLCQSRHPCLPLARASGPSPCCPPALCSAQVEATPSYLSATEVLDNGGMFVFLTNHGLIDALDVRQTFPGSASGPLVLAPGLPECQDPSYYCPTVLEPAREADGLVLGPLLEKIPGGATVKLPVRVSTGALAPVQRRRLQGDFIECFASVIATAFVYIW